MTKTLEEINADIEKACDKWHAAQAAWDAARDVIGPWDEMGAALKQLTIARAELEAARKAEDEYWRLDDAEWEVGE